MTKEVATLIGKNQNWTAKAADVLNLKGNAKYHQQIRASRTSYIQRYSEAAVQRLKAHLNAHPTFDPYA